jgi:hypothetical protein
LYAEGRKRRYRTTVRGRILIDFSCSWSAKILGSPPAEMAAPTRQRRITAILFM